MSVGVSLSLSHLAEKRAALRYDSHPRLHSSFKNSQMNFLCDRFAFLTNIVPQSRFHYTLHSKREPVSVVIVKFTYEVPHCDQLEPISDGVLRKSYFRSCRSVFFLFCIFVIGHDPRRLLKRFRHGEHMPKFYCCAIVV